MSAIELKRALIFASILMASIAMTFVGTLAQVDRSEAEKVGEEVKAIIKHTPLIPYIFGNNLMHCLLMFVPLLGLIYGMFVMYNTGVVIKMLSVALLQAEAYIAFFSLFLLPHAWIEYVVYSIAMSQGLWLIRAALKGEFKREVSHTYKWVTICAIALLIAAVIETILIKL